MTRRESIRGFTLIELSVVLIIIAVVTGVSISMGISVISTARLTATQQKMKVLDDALMQYRIANDRLPCPGNLTLAPGSADYGLEAGADSSSAIATGTGLCTGTGMLPVANFTGLGANNTFATGAEGAVPAVTLGLSPDMMLDGWGNKLRFTVDISYTAKDVFASAPLGCTNGAVTVNDSNGNARSTGALYVLISSGADGHGAYSRSGTVVNAGSSSADQLTNCHCTATAGTGTYAPTYVQKLPQYDSGQAGVSSYYFDDIVSFKERWQMQTTWDKAAGCALIYVGDTNNSRVQEFNSSGVYQSKFGSSGTANGQFNENSSYGDSGQIAIDASGNIWVPDPLNNRVQKFSGSGSYISQLGCTTGACSASAANGQFQYPVGSAIDSGGNIWVVDQSNYRVEKFNSSGSFLLGIGCGYQGVAGGVGAAGPQNGCFYYPSMIATDASGNAWVTDSAEARVQKFNSSGSWLLTIPSGCADSGFPACAASTTNGQFNYPLGVAIDQSGNIWVSDTYNNRVEEFNSSGSYVSQIGCAGGACSSGSGNGQLNYPDGLGIGGR